MRLRFLGQWMLWVCLLLVGSGAAGQTTIFNETFNEGNGATSGVDQFGTAWSVSCPTCEGYYEVVNNKLEQNNSGTSAGGNILPQFTTSNIDVSNCNTLTVRMMYEGDSYAGSGNFESEDECPDGAPTCAGDPDQFDQLGCFDCWDFFLVDLVFNDATTEQVRFIGANGDIPASATIDYESSCLGNRTQAFLRVRTQTWGSGETNMMDNVMIICNDPPSDINITQDPSGTFCDGDAVELAVNNAPGESFEWFDPNGNPIGGSSNSISFAASGTFGFGTGQTFSVISTDISGCKSSAMRNILVNDPPDADLPLDMTVCEGDDITLQETASDATGWMWGGPASGAPLTDTWVINNATLANSGTYTVSVTDGSSCIGTESVNVTVEPGGTFNLTTFADICENDAPLVLNTTQDGVDGNWSGFGVSSNIFDPASVPSGNYNLTFTPNSAGCLLPQQTPISVIASPLANSPVSPLEACGSGSAIFNLSTQDAIINGGTSLVVTWYEDAGLMNPIADPANFDSPSATVYAVLTENGCTSDVQQLDLLLTAGPEIMMPADVVACGSATLDPITIVDGSGTEAYYSEPGGNGAIILVGTTFTQDTIVYAFDSNGSCTTEQEIRITVGLNANPGTDLDLSLCSSGFINLLDYVDPSADPGNFEDGVGNVIAGNMILAEDFAGATIELFYRTDASGGCPSETAMYTIQVGVQNQAGPDTTARACFEQEYDLADFTFDQGMSGTFEMLDGSPILDTRVSSSDLFPAIEALYIVSTSNLCDPDTARIELLGEPAPSREVAGSVCSNYSTVVNGVTYNSANPSDTLVFSSAEFCDSIVFIDLQFRPENRILIDNTLCTGQEININGMTYNEANPIGSEVIVNGDQFGCDSIIEVDLTFDSEITTLLDFDLCSSQDTVINGTTYNAMSSAGSAAFVSSNGCDSIVMVDLNILQSSDSLISGLFCATDSLLIEGEVFNLSRPDGMFLSQFSNTAGCDSMIFVDLEFDVSRSVLIDLDLCSDRTVNINGTEYGAGNPTGIETIVVANECDSLYNIDLNILRADTILIDETFCSDTSIIVNSAVYDRFQSQGEEIIQGGSASGCNQYVFIDLKYIDSFEEDIVMELCYGDSIVVNGVTYGEANPSGIETLLSANGCDSIINVNLTFTGIQVDFQEGLADCTTGGGAILTIDVQQGAGLVDDVILDGVSILDQYQVSNLIEDILPGDHEVGLFSTDGCSIFYAFTVDEQVEETLSINVMNESDQFYQLKTIFSGQIASVIWSPSEGLSCVDCLNPEARPPSNTSYTVQVTDENGCQYTSSIELRFLASSVIYQPNIFSPNDDGFNDIFFLDSDADFDFTNFAIFDRWGNQVFQKVNGITGDPSLGWDGLGHEEGVYVYFIDLNFPDGSQTLSGEFSLIR
jgi:gliding motility-associated-like protein